MFSNTDVFAQTQNFYTIQPGGNLLDAVPQSEAYEFPQFEQGIVFLKNGVYSAAKLKYYLIFEEILFIHANGDTVTIANPEIVKHIYIGKDQFYYAGNKFVKLDTTIGDLKLTVAVFYSSKHKEDWRIWHQHPRGWCFTRRIYCSRRPGNESYTQSI